MENTSVDVQTGADGSLVVQPHGAMDFDTAATLRQILVYAVRRVRPVHLVLDLSDVSAMDSINLGTLAALCDLADDHHVAVSMENCSAAVGGQLTAAGVPPQRLRSRRVA
ncbi:STAS domain-containing protein [Krasilnikovia sp. MM14-A1004]|uniref:STAS domain-containing protein n=1 Tax=Krasilnikovia sp. MM14-A1004 TaxID=3373541 RepID=UPI00399D1566